MLSFLMYSALAGACTFSIGEDDKKSKKRRCEKVSKYLAYLEVEDKKLEEIMKRIDKAQEEIMKCHQELKSFSTLKITSAQSTTEQ